MAVQHFNQVELSRRWRLSPRTLERWRYRGTGPQYPQGRRARRLPARRHRDLRGRAAPRDQLGQARSPRRAAAAGAGVNVVGMARPRRIQPPRLTEIELCAWIAQAEPGAVLEYHRGYPRARPHRLRPLRRRAGPRRPRPARQPRPRSRRARARAPRPAPPRARGLQLFRHRPTAPQRRAPRLRNPDHHRGGRMMNAATNRPRLGDIRTMPIGEIAELPAPILALLQDEAEESVEGGAPPRRLAERRDRPALRRPRRSRPPRRGQGHRNDPPRRR